MSKHSSGSSGTSKGVSRVYGIPKRCWCEASVVAKLSKSDSNPYRRYFRCANAAFNKLVDDTHVFKWVDEALVNEIETLANSMDRVEKELKSIGSYLEDHDRMMMEKVENEVYEKVQELIGDAKLKMKVTIVGVVVVCVVIVCLMKLF